MNVPQDQVKRLQVELRPLFRWPVTILLLVIGCWLMGVCWQEWLSEPDVGGNFDCEAGRRWLVKRLGGSLSVPTENGVPAKVPFENVMLSQVVFTLLWWLGGALALARRRNISLSHALRLWGSHSAIWWLLAGSWTAWRLIFSVIGWTSAALTLNHIPEMWLSFASAGWLTTFVVLWSRKSGETNEFPERNSKRLPWVLVAGIVIYTLIYGVLNTLLYQNLLVPHGDSAMYEEHLWNFLHGKGFRSFIDQGLFHGEHIQIIHLGLIPIYILWPTHINLEWCESFALALGAIPVYFMALRKTGQRLPAVLLGCAYLLYLPMQRLDVSIDFKTFRPEAFGIPLLLAALNALDARNWRQFAIWIVAALLVKEDYALIIGPSGVWIAWDCWRRETNIQSRLRSIWPGLLLSLAAVVYLLWAVKIAIPYFRSGNPVHYARYYIQFGTSTNEIVWNMATKPGLLIQELVTVENFLFAASLTGSLALLPLLSPSRLAVGLPLFILLGLNNIARNTQHHFHAPLVAIVFWASAAGLQNLNAITNRLSYRGLLNLYINHGMRFAAVMTLFASSGFHFWHGIDPGSLPFWDQISPAYWKKKYVMTQRAREFAKVRELISDDQRLAATDFVHPRFNHAVRCYDYSSYRPDVPDDAEFLVVDVHGPYSEIRGPQDVGEYRRHPEKWELLPDQTEGEFLIFRRKRSSP